MSSQLSIYDVQGTGSLATSPDPAPPNPRPNIFDENNPDSLSARLGACDLLHKMHSAYDRFPELFAMEERDLWKYFSKKRAPVTVSENQLRYKFWTVYDHACVADQKMNIIDVYAGVMSYPALNSFCTDKPEKLAWVLCPPVSYEVANREALGFSSHMMRELLAVSPIEKDEDGVPTGKVNTKLAELQTKIHAMLELRVHGSITQRIEQKTLNLSMSDKTARKLINQYSENQSIEQLEQELGKLYEKERKILSLPKKQEEKPAPDPVTVEVAVERPTNTNF